MVFVMEADAVLIKAVLDSDLFIASSQQFQVHTLLQYLAHAGERTW